MIGDTADHLAQIGFRIEAVELGGFDKRIGYGSALSAGIGSATMVRVGTALFGPRAKAT